LASKICEDVWEVNFKIVQKYEALKNYKVYHDEATGKGVIFRTKVRWIEKGENPTKIFL